MFPGKGVLMKAIYGKKIGMTRIFDKAGAAVAVTLVEVKDNVVTDLKNQEKHGYKAVQIGAFSKKRLNKPEAGRFDKLNIKPNKVFEVISDKEYQIGDKITLEQFHEGENINVTGISKGKGFSGTVKRHGFHTGPKTHGSNNYRQPGSIGSTDAQRVFKGKRMAGHQGAVKITVKKLPIVKIDLEKKIMILSGAVPGANNSPVMMWSENEA